MGKIVHGLATVFFTLLLFTQCQQKQSNNAATDSGARLFTDNCARCHRTNGMGSPTPDLGINAPDIRQFKKSKPELVDIISNGYGKMPGFGHTISHSDISVIASYVATRIEMSSSKISTHNGLDQ